MAEETVLTAAAVIGANPVVPAVVEPAKTGDTPAVVVDPAKTGEAAAKVVETPKETVVEFKPYEVKAPDGVELKAESLKALSEFVNEKKIPEDTTKAFVDWYTKHQASETKAQADNWKTTSDGWVKSAKEDKEFGGTNFDGSVALARKAIEKFGTKEFNEMLMVTGAGNHPEAIRFLYRVGKAFSEDKLVTGAPASNAGKSAAEILFGNSK